MNLDEARRWKARLTYAHGVWRDKGLTDNSPPQKKATRFLDYYRGRQEMGVQWSGIADGDVVIDNVMFPIFNTLQANLYARNPKVDVISTRREEAPNAGRMERLVNHLLGKQSLRIRREMNRALLDAFPMPFAIVRHGFTPQAEKVDDRGNLIDFYDPAKPDFPWVRRWPAWDFRCDPTGQTLHPEDAWWCAFRSMIPLEHLRRNPNTINRRDLRPTHVWATDSLRKIDSQQDSPEESSLVEVWTFYDKERREWFQLTDGSDLPIRNPDEWPIPSWRTLPYNLLQFNEVPDDPFGISYGELIAPLQDDLNRVMTLALELAKRQRRIVVVDREGLAEGEAEKLEALSLIEFVFAKQGQRPQDLVKEIPVGGGFQELLLLAQYIKNEIRGMIGVGEMERGQRINVETAAEAQQVGAGSAVQRGRNQGPWEDFFTDVIEKFSLAVQDTVVAEIAIPIVGPEDAQELFAAAGPSSRFEEIGPEGIQGDFLYKIRPGSTLPHDPNEELRQEIALNGALQQFGEAVNWPQRLVDLALAAEYDPRRIAAPQQMQQGVNEQRAQALAAGAEPQQNGQVSPDLASLSALIRDSQSGRA